jgi:NAD(P)-dependent dehydrogenase (short-subunit alcohol dehydrogenase family)
MPEGTGMSAQRLQGKIALVTGAGNGIGRGCALIFAQQGATVIVCDADAAAAADTQREAASQGLAVTVMAPVDLMVEDAVTGMVADITERYGRLDILVNAAAVATFKWIEDLSLADWRRTMAGEVETVFLVTRGVWPLLKASGAASIINFSSVNAYHALDGSPALAHCAGKGAVLAMTRQLAMEGAPFNIRANSIAPGFVLTAATRAHLASDPAIEAKVLAKNMLKRLGTPEDIAWCATWLASDEARYVTGADISIDAGATAW